MNNCFSLHIIPYFTQRLRSYNSKLKYERKNNKSKDIVKENDESVTIFVD